VGVGVVPVPQRAQAEGVLEPFDLTVVRAEADGFVESVLPSGAAVVPGRDVLISARNDDLEIAFIRLLAEEQLTRIQRSAARVEETALAQSLDDRLESLRQQMERTERRLDALAITAPARGHWVAPDVERLRGAYVERGQEIGYVASLDALLVRAVADQRLGPRLESEIGIDAEVRVCVRGHPELEFKGRIQDLLPAGFRRLPSAALGYAAGGAMAVALDDETGTRSVDPFFEIHVSVPEDMVAGYRLCGGQRVVVRFELPDRPLAVIGWRALRQLVQRRFEI
jgi:putative peptide zinc metalloprotease protein